MSCFDGYTYGGVLVQCSQFYLVLVLEITTLILVLVNIRRVTKSNLVNHMLGISIISRLYL